MGKLSNKKSLENKKVNSSTKDTKDTKANDIESSLIETNNKKKNNEAEVEVVVNNNKSLKSIIKTNEPKTKKDGLVSRVRFKANKKNKTENKLLKLKTSDSIKKEKYEAIKEDIIKHVKQHDDDNQSEKKDDQSFVSRSHSRVTNAMIKSMLKLNNDGSEETAVANKNSSNFPKVDKQIKKKEKKNLKKEIWNKKIDLIKKEIQENVDKVKREKTVITGDIKPIIESLNMMEKPTKVQIVNQDTKTVVEVPVLSKRQKNELNKERQQSKAIQRESIRNKKAQDDISLFGQLLDYSEFVQNPLDTLKKLNK